MNIHDVTRDHLLIALKYCQETFGFSRYYDEPPKIFFRDRCRGKSEFGGFNSEKNELVVYRRKHWSYVDLMDTFVHEYIHHMQNLRLYNSYHKKYGYANNPQEQEAEEIASQHKWACKQYVTKHLKQ